MDWFQGSSQERQAQEVSGVVRGDQDDSDPGSAAVGKVSQVHIWRDHGTYGLYPKLRYALLAFELSKSNFNFAEIVD